MQAHTHLWHIVDRYHNLADYTLFLPGSPNAQIESRKKKGMEVTDFMQWKRDGFAGESMQARQPVCHCQPLFLRPKPSFHSAAVHPDDTWCTPACVMIQHACPAFSGHAVRFLPEHADLLDNLSGRDFYCPTHSAPAVTDVVSHRRPLMPCTPGTASLGPRGA